MMGSGQVTPVVGGDPLPENINNQIRNTNNSIWNLTKSWSVLVATATTTTQKPQGPEEMRGIAANAQASKTINPRFNCS